MREQTYGSIQKGDVVSVRNTDGVARHATVDRVTTTRIVCGVTAFDRTTGFEVGRFAKMRKGWTTERIIGVNVPL